MIGLALAASVLATATPAAPSSIYIYSASFELKDHGVVIGRPILITAEGTPAWAEVGGAKGYRLSLLIKRAGEIDHVAIEVYLMRDGVWKLVDKPKMDVTPGAKGDISIAHDDGLALKVALNPAGQLNTAAAHTR